MAGWSGMRVGDGDREAAAALLREHYAAGRLSLDEFQDRLAAVYAAQVQRDLAAVTADLPAGGMNGAVPLVRSLRRASRRVMLWGLGVFAGLLALLVLLAVAVPHGGFAAVVLGVLLAPVLGLSALVAAGAWAARRAWRSGAWLDAVPAAAGMPWLSRVILAARALLAGRAFVRMGRRARRPLRPRPATAYYQDHPGGSWHQARVNDPRVTSG